MRVLVTGAAGFIGFHLARELLRRGDSVVGLDNFNAYYDPALKDARAGLLHEAAAAAGKAFRLHRASVEDAGAVEAAFGDGPFDRVFHFAAQAGVRHSIADPSVFVHSNIVGFANVLEACRQAKTSHLVYASSSSVYGASAELPYHEGLSVAHPLQLYASTKRANELMAHSYSHLYDLPTTGLRLFSVYGPWGRPDMALLLFARRILDGQPIFLSNMGEHSRDLTYIDDVVRAALAVGDSIPHGDPNWDPRNPDPATGTGPFQILNVGSGRPVALTDFVAAIEDVLGVAADRRLVPKSKADMLDTFADISRIRQRFGFEAATSLAEGVKRTLDWYREYEAGASGGPMPRKAVTAR